MFIQNCATITTIWFWNIFTTSKQNSVPLEVTPRFPAYTRPTHWVIYFLSLQTSLFWKFHVTGFCSRSEFSSLHLKPFQWAYSSNSFFSFSSASPPAILSNRFFPVLLLFPCPICLWSVHHWWISGTDSVIARVFSALLQYPFLLRVCLLSGNWPVLQIF